MTAVAATSLYYTPAPCPSLSSARFIIDTAQDTPAATEDPPNHTAAHLFKVQALLVPAEQDAACRLTAGELEVALDQRLELHHVLVLLNSQQVALQAGNGTSKSVLF
jgi:hypothetical protein